MAAEKSKYVYVWTDLKRAEAYVDNNWDRVRGLLGGKGANLAKMAAVGLPVPPGFTISTEACLAYSDKGDYPDGMWEACLTALKEIEATTGKKFGNKDKPLLVSCRSGAKFSMPGMMDTVLNIGLNDETCVTMAKLTNDRFVQDAYRRLIQGFGSVVMGIPDEHFEDALKKKKDALGYKEDTQMSADDWRGLIVEYKAIFKRETKIDFPQDALDQMKRAIGAVFGSWNSKRAIAYRNRTGISHTLGTACNIQTMAFGNMGNDSATGVAFTRHPGTGEKTWYGDYLTNAQGEDVVAGIRNCTPVGEMGKEFPECFQQLQEIGAKLEAVFKNMQDIEFTIEQKKLYMLQTRDGKRTAKAQARIAVEMVEEKLIDKEEAVRRLSPADVNILLLPQLDIQGTEAARKEGRMVGKGVNASPGGAVGMAVFDANTAEKWQKDGKDVILVRPFTKPDDVHGFFASKGILTAEGGATSHAAVVARQFGMPCIVGASIMEIDLAKRQFTVKGTDVLVKEGDWIAINATTGEIFTGKIGTQDANFDEEKELHTLLSWSDEICKREYQRGDATMKGLQVWANADNRKDATRARAYGAQGIGLCRTEHMFFETTRLPIVQDMILAKNDEIREAALAKLLVSQRSDFEDLFEVMDGLPVIIRLLDPPLHEFLPDLLDLTTEVATIKGSGGNAEEKQELLDRVHNLHESNPMMGLRGVRLSIIIPGILRMQVRAIIEAALNVKAKGKVVLPEIMIPLTSTSREMKEVKPLAEAVVQKVFDERKDQIHYKIGTMIETPRGALVAGHLAQYSEFFSCGTNDLTQMTFGISRDDAEREFLLDYIAKGIMPANPFQTMDWHGVGRLVHMACKQGREVRPDLSVGICGEHGGDPTSIGLCHWYGLNYVSCSPFRVPAARLAAAQAALQGGVEPK